MRASELLIRIANNNKLFDFNQLNSAESIEMFQAAYKLRVNAFQTYLIQAYIRFNRQLC